MFTGIISGVGRIAAVRALGSSLSHGKQVVVVCPPGYASDIGVGDSIAINGACMTATAVDAAKNEFRVDVSTESLARTAGLVELGPVNLEKALRAQDRLGGHIVSGHVDGVGIVARFEPVGESWLLQVLAPRELAKFFAFKGSIAVNGASLTVNQVEDLPSSTATEGADGTCRVSINLIPHTVQNTALGSLKPGAKVNLEIDLIARYVERMLQKETV